jgi:hypothetical protein
MADARGFCFATCGRQLKAWGGEAGAEGAIAETARTEGRERPVASTEERESFLRSFVTLPLHHFL